MPKATPTVIAGYWDRIANHMTEAMQYLAAVEDLTTTPQAELRNRMVGVQAEVSHHRAQAQHRLPQGHG